MSIDKLLMTLCAWRNLGNDTLAWTTRDAINPLLDDAVGPYALGGPDAAAAHLQGRAVAFATRGWQASEFRTALRSSFIREREWDQTGDGR